MKRFSISVTAVIMAIAFAAFTMPEKAEVRPTNNTYRYTLSTNMGDDNPSNYVWTNDLTGCSGSQVVCIISSPGPTGAGAHPSFPLGTDPYSNNQGVSVVSQKPQ
jgi:hypothetical protein